MNRRELETNVQNLFDGRLGRENLLKLETELRECPEARRTYREYAHLHNLLGIRSEGMDLLKVVPMDRVLTRQNRRTMQMAGLAAVAVLALGAIPLALNFVKSPPLRFTVAPGTEYGLVHPGPESSDKPDGLFMEIGSQLEVGKGAVELELDSHVRAVVRGPARLTLVRKDRISLSGGKAWFHVPPGAEGFQVETPEFTLTDLGTEFGIVADPVAIDEVHVFVGKVEIGNSNGRMEKEILTGGNARVAGSAGGWKELPLRRDLFLDELPETVGGPSDVVVTEVFDTHQSAYADEVSATDLLHGLKPKVSGWNFSNNASPLELTDGFHGAGYAEIPGDLVQGAWTTVGATAEYDLGSGPYGRGYDITGIQSIADWISAGFGNQAWTVEVRPVGGKFEVLETVGYFPLRIQGLVGGGTSKVTLRGRVGALAKGIESVRFTAGHVPNSEDQAFVWREVDVFGEPTGAGR